MTETFSATQRVDDLTKIVVIVDVDAAPGAEGTIAARVWPGAGGSAGVGDGACGQRVAQETTGSRGVQRHRVVDAKAVRLDVLEDQQSVRIESVQGVTGTNGASLRCSSAVHVAA